jgi:hypothetical protein
MSKILYKLSFGAAIFILLSGAYFKISEHFVSGLIFRKNGNISTGTIDGNGTLVLGVMILLFSIWMYRDYKIMKRENERKRNREEKEILYRRKNNGRSLPRP